MSRPKGEDPNRNYEVHYSEWGAWVTGYYAPTGDVSALLKEWSYRGMRVMSRELARRLGALVVVVEHVGDERSWMEELDAETP